MSASFIDRRRPSVLSPREDPSGHALLENAALGAAIEDDHVARLALDPRLARTLEVRAQGPGARREILVRAFAIRDTRIEVRPRSARVDDVSANRRAAWRRRNGRP